MRFLLFNTAVSGALFYMLVVNPGAPPGAPPSGAVAPEASARQGQAPATAPKPALGQTAAAPVTIQRIAPETEPLPSAEVVDEPEPPTVEEILARVEREAAPAPVAVDPDATPAAGSPEPAPSEPTPREATPVEPAPAEKLAPRREPAPITAPARRPMLAEAPTPLPLPVPRPALSPEPAAPRIETAMLLSTSDPKVLEKRAAILADVPLLPSKPPPVPVEATKPPAPAPAAAKPAERPPVIAAAAIVAKPAPPPAAVASPAPTPVPDRVKALLAAAKASAGHADLAKDLLALADNMEMRSITGIRR